ncbi:MAG: DUF4832 domain-containing protein [Deltaproteobacteria bacterium]|nr:DUF4832 domain-containing protein [Deltaproteobacteria bacterium]
MSGNVRFVVLVGLCMVGAAAGCGDDAQAPSANAPMTDGGGEATSDAASDGKPGDDASPGEDAKPDVPPATGPTTTVTPAGIDDILINPGIGFADFGWNPPPAQYPAGSVAYRRWTWAELEPVEGQYAFAMVDKEIADAKAKGEDLAFRIMTAYDTSSPQWLLDKGVGSIKESDGTFPDHNHPLFLEYHKKLVDAFGARYSGALEVDHVDIGSVGCWGEWNTACCEAAEKATCDQYFPTEDNQKAIIDWYVAAFPKTPLVALIGAPSYAESKGAGWRGDCFGDYGFFGSTWNHMEDMYEPASKDPIIGIAWQHAPVQFESCGVMQDWLDKGFDIDLILQKGLEWHMSVFNAKSSPVPDAWRPKVDEWLKHVGYRLVLTELTHTAKAKAGQSLSLDSKWENKGVAPPYHPWPIGWRLRSSQDAAVASWTSAADLRGWLPGPYALTDLVQVPTGVAAGKYSLEVAVLTEDASLAHVRLAIAGVRPDLWYPVSEVTIEP